MREQLRQAEEQLQASRQQASLLASELRDCATTRDHTMSELYCARVEADKLRASLADAQAECQRMESQLDRMRRTAEKVSFDVFLRIISHSVINYFCDNVWACLSQRVLGKVGRWHLASQWHQRQKLSSKERWKS